MIVKGKTTSGFKFEVNSEVLSCWDYIDAVAMSQSDDESEQIIGFVNMIKIMMGKEGIKALKEHLGNDMKITDVNKEITDIMKKIQTEVKNQKNS